MAIPRSIYRPGTLLEELIVSKPDDDLNFDDFDLAADQQFGSDLSTGNSASIEEVADSQLFDVEEHAPVAPAAADEGDGPMFAPIDESPPEGESPTVAFNPDPTEDAVPAPEGEEGFGSGLAFGEAAGMGALSGAADEMEEQPLDDEEEGGKKKKKKAKKRKQSDEEDEEGPTLLGRIAKTSPYTVMLGLSLVVLLIAVVCLYMELRGYNFDTKAKEGRQRAMAVPVQSAFPSTTATA
jgi:hypothetical protein